MKVCVALIVLLPLTFCAAAGYDSNIATQAKDQKRFFLYSTSLAEVRSAICRVISLDASHPTCEAVCPVALATIPGGRTISFLCVPACQSIDCFTGSKHKS